MLDIPQATTLRAVDDAWRNYNGKRTEAAWQVYVGLLAQHYSRAITLAPVPVNPKRKP
jgi:acyl-CoA-binding protein